MIRIPIDKKQESKRNKMADVELAQPQYTYIHKLRNVASAEFD